jgi:hypothetical protein
MFFNESLDMTFMPSSNSSLLSTLNFRVTAVGDVTFLSTDDV